MNPELLYPAALLAGFFGSTHCLGMCGAIVVLFEQQSSTGIHRWLRRILYNLGRLGFYLLLGTIAGGASAVIVATAGARSALLVLRLFAGLLVIAIGLNLVFNWNFTRFLEVAGSGLWKRLSPLARHFLPVETPARAIGAGFLWGALPCGLVYSAVVMAATSGSPAGGAIIMLFFWLGTVPALVLAGASAERLHQWKSQTIFRRAAGAIMIVIGVLAMAPLRMLIH
jgi:sulfite exporter TauE/SafE